MFAETGFSDQTGWRYVRLGLMLLGIANALPAQSIATDAEYVTLLEQALAADVDAFESPFEAAVRKRAEWEKTEEIPARIAVLEDLAALAKKKNDSAKASSHLGHTMRLASKLADADLLIPINLKLAELELVTGDRFAARTLAQSVWEMAEKLSRPEDQVAAGLILAQFHFRAGNNDELVPLFEHIPALAPSDPPEGSEDAGRIGGSSRI